MIGELWLFIKNQLDVPSITLLDPSQLTIQPRKKKSENRSNTFRCAALSTSICRLSKGKEKFLATLHRHMEIHGTVYYETQRPPEVPAFVKNHGLLPQPELQQLLRKAKVGQHQVSLTSARWF